MSARDMSRRGTVGGGRARFQPRARGANRSFRGRGSAFLSVSSCFSSRKPAFDWELLPLLLRFVRGAQGQAWSDSVRSDHRMQAEPDMLEMRSMPYASCDWTVR